MNLCKKRIAGVILAAGSGSRMEKIKQLLPCGKKTILDQVIYNARCSDLNEIIVVLGYCSDKIERTVNFFGTKIVINTEYSKGQSSSLKTGLDKVSNSCDGVMFLLGDQPLINSSVINSLIVAFEISDAPIIIPYCNGKRGNPVIIARPLFHRLRLLSADAGARLVFKEFEHEILKVSVDDKAILFDVDTEEDYKKLISFYNCHEADLDSGSSSAQRIKDSDKK